MIFDLAKLKNDTKVVTQDDFIGTALENDNFSIEITKINREDKIDVASESLKNDGDISLGKYNKNLFIGSIVAVSGFVDSENNEYDLETAKNLIWEYAPDILIEKIKTIVEDFDKTDEKKSESPEQDFTPEQIG